MIKSDNDNKANRRDSFCRRQTIHWKLSLSCTQVFNMDKRTEAKKSPEKKAGRQQP